LIFIFKNRDFYQPCSAQCIAWAVLSKRTGSSVQFRLFPSLHRCHKWLRVHCTGELSQRMQIPGNVWVEVWNSARPLPARRQRRLF